MAANPLPVTELPRKRAASERLREAAGERDAEMCRKRAIDRAHRLLERLELRQAHFAKQISQLQKRKACACARAERLEDRILSEMSRAHLDRCDGFHVQLLARGAPAALVVLDEAAIPETYLRTKIVSEPMKVEIKAALARGEEIPGVRLTQKVSLLRK